MLCAKIFGQNTTNTAFQNLRPVEFDVRISFYVGFTSCRCCTAVEAIFIYNLKSLLSFDTAVDHPHPPVQKLLNLSQHIFEVKSLIIIQPTSSIQISQVSFTFQSDHRFCQSISVMGKSKSWFNLNHN